jgi:hypothetical protein
MSGGFRLSKLKIKGETSMLNITVEIVVREDLSQAQIVYFEGLQVKKSEDDCTHLSGQLADDSALYGLLDRLRDLNLHLVSVQVNPTLPKGITK